MRGLLVLRRPAVITFKHNSSHRDLSLRSVFHKSFYIVCFAYELDLHI